VIYLGGLFLIAGPLLTPFVLRRYRGTLGRTLREYRWHALIIGIGSAGAYLMILFAFTVGKVGYIVGVREVAVVIGALAGVILLNERFTFSRALAIVAIAIGAVFIKAG